MLDRYRPGHKPSLENRPRMAVARRDISWRSLCLAISAILAILTLELLALARGINGLALTLAIAALAALGGASARHLLPELLRRDK